jgi:hypothetical protein
VHRPETVFLTRDFARFTHPSQFGKIYPVQYVSMTVDLHEQNKEIDLEQKQN